MRTFIFVSLLLVTLMACRKEVEEHYVTLGYEQTFCADPWQNDNNDSTTINNVANYLSSASLYATDIWIDQGGETGSKQDCTSKTGKLIHVNTLASDSLLARYRRIGFQ
ncbi:MAG: hypothetical protein NVSMB63_02290 [Sediminibacterium sp.]